MSVLDWLAAVIGRRVFGDSGSFVEHLNRESVRFVAPTGRTLELNLLYGQHGTRLMYESDLMVWTIPDGQLPLSASDREEVIEVVGRYCRRHHSNLQLVRATDE